MTHGCWLARCPYANSYEHELFPSRILSEYNISLLPFTSLGSSAGTVSESAALKHDTDLISITIVLQTTNS